MPSKMATYRKPKAVLVAVYVETPRRRRLSSNNHHHHHYYHHHYHHLHRPKHGGNRRAELLDYSRRLRESARSTPSMPLLHPKPAVASNDQPPMKQLIAVRSKPKHTRAPACLGNWKIAMPSFLRSLTSFQAKKERKTKKKRTSGSTSTKMKSIMKSFEVHKKKGFVSKLLAALKKHR